MTRNITCAPKDLVLVIEKDPVITMKILKILNSAYYCLPQKITAVSQCVVLLGFNTIKNIALNIASIGILPKRNAAQFDVQQYLLHSLATASVARLLAGKLPRGENADPTDCYIAGLLHDIGKVVFAQFMAEKFREALSLSKLRGIPLHETEQEVIGEDHSVVGAMLAEHWQFPPTLSSSIRHHHQPDGCGTPLGDCLWVANQVTKKLSLGDSGNSFVEELTPRMQARFGGGLNVVIESLGDLSGVMAEAKMFTHMEGGA
jgi:putative nucleotidyltransferase with HDIG domain